MKAEQLIQQYESGGDARLFVEGVWEGISEDMNESHILDTYPILLRFWTTEQWTAAAAFTLARLEEIRQAKEDVEQANGRAETYTRIASDFEDTKNPLLANGRELLSRKAASWQRILALVRAHLDELSRGIKPEALA